jgi:predicted  nucleic acid-binding Zn-ribbon protein
MQHIEKDLKSLLKLQELDKQLDSILHLEGELPQEIQKLENDLVDLTTQAQTCEEGIKEAEQTIAKLRIQIKELERDITRYEEQQLQIRNSREYDAINKELELHQLDIQLAEKKIKTIYDRIDKLQRDHLVVQAQIDSASSTLKVKKDDLDAIIKESQEEQEQLTEKREKRLTYISKSLLQQYESIREHMPNKLGVVKVQNGACEGCFTIVPPQFQSDIQEKIDVLSCEHCGRIFGDVVNVTIMEQEEEIVEE